MIRKSVITLASGWRTIQPSQPIDCVPHHLHFATRLFIRIVIRTTTLLMLLLMLLLTLSNTALAQTLIIDINAVGLNENQSKATTQLNQACDSLGADTSAQAVALQEVCDLVNSLDANDAEDSSRLQEIANAVVPEEAFALNDSLSVFSGYQTTNVLARLNALRNSEPANIDAQESELSLRKPTTFGLTQVGGGASADLVAPLGVFINGDVSSGEFDGGQLQQDADLASSSFTIGGDYRFHKNVVAGLGVGFIQDEVKFSSVSGGAESDGFNLTAFATWYEKDQGYLDVVLDFSRSDYTLERSITIFQDNPLTAKSSPSALATSFTVSGGRNFNAYGFDLGGYFRLSYTGATIDAYSESLTVQQAGFAPLFRINDQLATSTKMVVGLNLSKAISLNNAVLLPMFRIEYVRENDRKKDGIEATLSSTGTMARYEGEDRAVRYSNLGLGASALFRGGRSAFAYYETHLQNDVVSQNWWKTGVRLEF